MKAKSENQPYATLAKTSVSALVLCAMGVVAPAFAQTDTEAESEIALEEVIVRGQRASIQNAQEIKRDADSIMDVVAADDIGALPDRSVTETLQRIVGVSIDRYMSQGDPEHFSVEGNGVIVRGLTEVRSELNGRSSFSADGGRTLSFGDVPPELLASVAVIKSPTADLIEGGLSGTVDLVTRMPFDQDEQMIAVTAGANYGSLDGEVNPNFSGLYSNTWDTGIGKIGFLVNLAHSELYNRNDSMYVRPFFARDDVLGQEGNKVFLPRGADWRTMHFNSERNGQYAALQWAPNDNHELSLTYFNSDYDMNWDESAIFVSNDVTTSNATADSVYNDNGRFVSGRFFDGASPDAVTGTKMGTDRRVSEQNSVTTDTSLRYRFHNEKMEFEIALQNVDAESVGIDSTIGLGVRVPYIDIDLSGSLPVVSSDAAYLADASNYTWDFLMDNQYDNTADMQTAEMDFKFYFASDVIRSVKAGVRFSDSSSDNFNTGYNWGGVGNWMYDSGLIESGAHPDPSDLELADYSDFFDGEAQEPSGIFSPLTRYATGFPESYQEIIDKITYVDNGWFVPEDNIWQPRDLSDEQWYNSQEEKTAAAYVRLDFGFDDLPVPIEGNVGVRYVETDNTAYGYLTFPQQELFGNGAFEPMAAEHSYDNWLPSLNVKFELAEDLFLRFAAARAMTRPTFSSLKSQLSLNASVKESSQYKIDDEGQVIEGEELLPSDYDLTSDSDTNPYLDPMVSDQLDLSLEWYYADSSSLSAAIFTKDIEGYQATEIVRETYAAEGSTPYEYVIERPVSTGTADINGLELAVNHFFTNLPSPFDGIGVQANYTYIDSSTDVEADADPVDTDGSSYGTIPYRGLSEHAYNLVGIYEKGPFSFRLAYNWRSEYLLAVGANGFNGSVPISGEGFVRPWGEGTEVDWRLPVYNGDTGYLDASLTYSFTDNLSLVFQANNLTNTVTKNVVEQNAVGKFNGAYHASGTRYSLSLRATF